MKTILFHSSVYDLSRGAGKVALEICRSFRERGFNTHLILEFNRQQHFDIELPLGINIHKIEHDGKVDSNYIERIKQILNRVNPDIVNIHLTDEFSLPYFIFKRLINYNLILSFHGYDTIEMPMSVKKMLNEFSTSIDGSICVSEYLRKVLLEKIPNISNPIVIYNGIDLEYWTIRKKERKNNSVNIIAIGALERRKGHDVLLSAIAQIKQQRPNLHLIIAGDGPCKKNLESSIENLNLENHVKLIGHVSTSQIKNLLSSSDLLVHPSRSESFGMVLLESMAVGTLPIAANVGGIPEVIGDAGVLFETENSKDLATKLLMLSENIITIESRGKALKEQVSKFDKNKMTQRYAMYFESFLITKTD